MKKSMSVALVAFFCISCRLTNKLGDHNVPELQSSRRISETDTPLLLNVKEIEEECYCSLLGLIWNSRVDVCIHMKTSTIGETRRDLSIGVCCVYFSSAGDNSRQSEKVSSQCFAEHTEATLREPQRTEVTIVHGARHVLTASHAKDVFEMFWANM
jgi:hypothetical protein